MDTCSCAKPTATRRTSLIDLTEAHPEDGSGAPACAQRTFSARIELTSVHLSSRCNSKAPSSQKSPPDLSIVNRVTNIQLSSNSKSITEKRARNWQLEIRTAPLRTSAGHPHLTQSGPLSAGAHGRRATREEEAGTMRARGGGVKDAIQKCARG